nr:uncharacterized protein LOC118028377 [Populus alba]
MINGVWVEMVAHAAAHCPWKEHIHQLRRGGELLTHVSLLMLHLGLSEQYETKTYNEFCEILRLDDRREYFNSRDKYFRDTEDMSGSSPDEEEEEEEYFQAGEKYLEGTTIMSGSSVDERLKELEKIVANTKRDLERVAVTERDLKHKKQELKRERRVLKREERVLKRMLSIKIKSLSN